MNIIATHRPGAARKLALAAHYDSKYFKNSRFIGATDSAASGAILLDLATSLTPLLDLQSRNLDVTLQVIFFDGEEAFVSWTATDSIYGARHLAAKWMAEKVLVKNGELVAKDSNGVPKGATERSVLDGMDLLILLDLVGMPDFSVMNVHEKSSKVYERVQRIEGRLRKQDLMNTKKISISFFGQRGAARVMPPVGDDHVPFMERGVPVLHVIPFQFPSVWHTAEDEESAVDMGSVDDMGRVMKVFVCEYLDL